MKRKIFPLAMILFLAACGGTADSLDEGADDVTAPSWQLVTIRRDERRCAAPMCGGFWVSKAQSDSNQAYVADLDFSKSTLDAETQQMIRSAPAEELLLRARIGAADKRGARDLLIKDAYRGMPEIVPAATDGMYSVAQKSVAKDSASGKSAKYSAVDVSGAAKAFVDQAWLANRVEAHGALAAAHVANAVLAASQVWVHLPEAAGPCAKPVEQACGDGEVQAYVRTADRCLEPAGCVARAVCPMMQPSCPAGYVATTWMASTGCAATACDPAWVR